MKKLLAVLMAVLVAFSALSVVVFAEDVNDGAADAGVAEAADNDVTPKNFVQLITAFFVKSFEKVSNFFIGLFGENSDRVNNELAQAVYEVMNKLFGTTQKADIITTQAAA